MLTGPDDARLQGKTGSSRLTAEVTRLDPQGGQKSLLQNALVKLALPGRLAKLCPRFCSSEGAMKFLRIHATPDGESNFGDADIPTTTKPLFPNEAPFRLSGHYPASRIRFVHVPAGVREAGWHTPPGRVLAVWLDGIVEFETSDGDVRRVSAESSVLVEDTHGKGTSHGIPWRGRV